MTQRQIGLKHDKQLSGFRGIVRQDGQKTIYGIGTRQRRRLVVVRTLRMTSL